MTDCYATASDIFLEIEAFICQLFKSSFKTLAEVRWYLHIVKRKQCKDLPPSKSSMIPHIQRAQYHCIQYHQSIVPHLKQINIENYGCEKTKLFQLCLQNHQRLMNYLSC